MGGKKIEAAKWEPCPKCKTDEFLSIYSYEVSRCVECDKCYYRGPITGNLRAALKAHNNHSKEKLAMTQPDADKTGVGHG